MLAAWPDETYRRNARGLRDRQAFEAVRMQAGTLSAAGRSHAEVARILGVSRQNVSRWHARWQAGGLQTLESRGPTGTARACLTSSSTTWTKRCARAPAPMGSTPITGPWSGSPR